MFDDPEYLAWAMTVPADITADAIWRTPAYRLSLFAMSRAQIDATRILANRLSRPHLDQLTAIGDSWLAGQYKTKYNDGGRTAPTPGGGTGVTV